MIRPLIQDSDWVAATSTFSSSARPGSGKLSWRGHLARRRAATVSLLTSQLPRSCFGNSNWDGLMAAMPRGLRALGQVDVLIVDDWAMAPLAEARSPRLSGDLRRAIPDQVDPPDQPVAGREVARTDRRPHGGRQYPGSTGACGAPDRITGRIDAEEEGRRVGKDAE